LTALMFTGPLFAALIVIALLMRPDRPHRPGRSSFLRCGDCGAVLGLSKADLPRLMTGPWEHRCGR